MLPKEKSSYCEVMTVGAYLLFCCAFVMAQVPRAMNYQGYLTSSGGTPLNGTYSITFRIYDAATGGNLLWYETKSVTVTNGYFDVQLDLSVNGGDTLKFGRPYWIALEVGSDGEMSPREKLAPVVFAFRSIYADTADYAEGFGGGIPSRAYVAFPDSSPRPRWTYTGYSEFKGRKWTIKAPMPTARYGSAAAVVNGKIYVVGGYYCDDSSHYLSTNEEYEPGTLIFYWFQKD